MKKFKDVYGRELMGFYRSESQVEVIERNDGLIDARGPFGRKYYLSEYKDWAPFEKKAMKLVKGRVLDIGCGAGRHSLYFQKKGLKVLEVISKPLSRG